MPDEKDQNEQSKQETEYLREAVRLAELRIEQQQRTDEINQRKAVLFITFCFAMAGYLYAGKGAETQCLPSAVWGIGKAVLGALLLAAIVCAVFVVNFAYWKVHGVEPSYTMDEYFGENYNKMARDLLEYYDEFFKNNKEVLDKKGEYLLWARNFGFPGMALFFILILVESVACFITAL